MKDYIHCYNSFTGNPIYISDRKEWFKYRKALNKYLKNEESEPKYCESCGKEKKLYLLAITGHSSFTCKECCKKYYDIDI